MPEHEEHAAVDLSQFRNTVVGKGYQAKHVVRQKQGAAQAKVTIIDKTKPSEKQKPTPTKKDKSSKKKVDPRVARYLQVAGLRQFRKELESIVQSS